MDVPQRRDVLHREPERLEQRDVVAASRALSPARKQVAEFAKDVSVGHRAFAARNQKITRFAQRRSRRSTNRRDRTTAARVELARRRQRRANRVHVRTGREPCALEHRRPRRSDRAHDVRALDRGARTRAPRRSQRRTAFARAPPVPSRDRPSGSTPGRGGYRARTSPPRCAEAPARPRRAARAHARLRVRAAASRAPTPPTCESR